MPNYHSIRFSTGKPDFFSVLNKRVNDHFKTKNTTRHATPEMVIKTIFMFSLYFVPYLLMMTGVVTGMWGMLALCCVMGLGIAGIGLSVMHDANHGAYSKSSHFNNLLGYSLNFIGGNAFNWRIQHNVLHHTFTNIHDVDEDISPRGVLRMSPHGEWKYFHRFQHIYAWFLYGLMTVIWVLVKDFSRIVKYNKDGLIKKQKTDALTQWIILILTKTIYAGYAFVLPVMVLELQWWQVLTGLFIMHYIAGFILAIIFQPAHVIEGTEYHMPDDAGNMENNWAIHQLLTTTNFANKSKVFSWYAGGLNFQIEHHLFPHVCHVHYRELSTIVKATAAEFGVPYKSHPTFVGALINHGKLLRELGRNSSLQSLEKS